jgi:diguanylate cyclase (GGDEF)-like protein
MRLFGRQDLLLVVGFSTALVIVFSKPIARLFEYAREVEQQSGLTLLPALFLLAGVLTLHQLVKKNQVLAQAAASQIATEAAEKRAEELERLVSFGQALGRALDFDAIRAAIGNHLPAVAATEKVWVLVNNGATWRALTGEPPATDNDWQLAQLGERLAKQGTVADSSGAIGFPLVVGGSMVGVLGIRPEGGRLAVDRQRIIEAAAALLAVSVKNAQLFSEVRDNSVTDGLTGANTRTHAMEVIDAELRRARHSQSAVSLILFDLDHFKEINDTHGHLCGDAVLHAVGARMHDVLRGSDLKCRYGGEEFLVLLPETPLHGARRVAETLRREIAERSVQWSGGSVTVSASFGIAQALPGEVNVQELIRRADRALYRAKEEGRNCIRIAEEETMEPSLATSVERAS